jgi:ATP-dependent RNA helicase HrpB
VKLPIEKIKAHFEDVFRALKPGGRIVLTAPTGSGKSTRIPLWCQDCSGGKVLVVEPRRVAARTLAEWVAKGRDQRVGQSVGYTIRFENRTSQDTEILFVTPGVARRFLTEGTLADFQTVIFDEFHERSWETDALLALTAAQQAGPRLVIMSATLMATRLAERYSAELIQAEGRTFEVATRYEEGDAELTVPTMRHLASRASRAVKKAWNQPDEQSVLVFLPGLSSMTEVASSLGGLPVVLLHGTYSQKEQARAFAPDQRKIVLATNVAESSLTIPDVTTVVDSGLEKRQIHQSGYVALATVPVAQSSADQRAGRAGRVRPGTCIRLWSEQASLEASRPPDICRMELDDLVLFLASLPEGLASPAKWVETPPDFAWERARDRLIKAGLISQDGFLTQKGESAQRLPIEQDWARVLVTAPRELAGDLCDLCSLATARRSPMKNTRCEDALKARKEDLGEDPWNQALNLVRVADPLRHAVDGEGLKLCRRVADELRGLCGAGNRPAESGKQHPDLQPYLARVWPERFFLLRSHGRGWGNGQVECRLPRSEQLPEDCTAAFFLQVSPTVARGLKVELQGRWGLPTRLSVLRRAGLGEPELSKIRWLKNKLTARVVYVHVGRELGGSEEELKGEALRKALGELAARGSWRREVLEQMKEEQFYLHLDARLKGREYELLDPQTLMRKRLEILGVNACEELDLLEAEDFLQGQMDASTLETLHKDYPRLYRFGGLTFEMEYLPKRRRVVMHSLSQSKGAKLKPQHLPRWNGWKVELDEKGRRTVLRA